jgi:hypothetical protein
MNETMSLVLATAILAIGGVGFYMYKQSDDNNDADYYDDNSISNDDDNSDDDSISDDSDSELEDEDFIEYEPKASKQKPKTKRNKTTGGTRKKRY